MQSIVGFTATALLVAQAVIALAANPSDMRDVALQTKRSSNDESSGGEVREYTFSTPVDHFHDDSKYEPHSSDFYSMRYFLDSSYYKSGGPVIFLAPDEGSIDDRRANFQTGIGTLLAKATGGLVVLPEHRYYGKSAPMPAKNWTTETYRFLTTEQALADIAYFAQRIQFPGLEDHNLAAPNTPWIIYGGSYSGAVAAFARKTYPDIFWGAISSSGVTAAVYDFWEYATRLFAPGDCGAVMGKLTHVVDTALLSGNETKVDAIKQFFGYENIEAADLGETISHPLYALQGQKWVKGKSDESLSKYCAILTSRTLKYPEFEKKRAVAEQLVKDAGYYPDAATRLLNYAGLRDPLAPPDDAGTTLNKAEKRDDDGYWFDEYVNWDYQKCTQWGYFVNGENVPKDTLGILSRAVTLKYASAGCELFFNITTPPDTDAINRLGGYNFSYPRVAIIGGKQDPWRAVTPHKIGINEARKSTTSEPFILIDYANHCWDTYDIPESEYKPGYPPQQIVDVHNQEVEFVKAWLKEFNETRSH